MTIRHLRVFIKVSELESISKAADEMHVAQPSVSETIKQLEDYYNTSLFIRTRKGIQLTKEGQYLLGKAKDVVKEFDDFEVLARKEDLNQEVRIGCTLSYGEYNLENLHHLLKEGIPEIQPTYYVETSDMLEEGLLKGDIDFAFTEKLPSSPLLKAIELGEDSVVAVASKNFDCKQKMSLEELATHNLLVREKNSFPRQLLDTVFENKGLYLNNIRMVSISNNAIKSMLKNTKAIGILPKFSVKNELESGEFKVIELDTEIRRKLYIVHLASKNLNKTTKAAKKIGSIDSSERFKERNKAGY